MAADADLSKQLVGSWEFSATNTMLNGAAQTMTTETQYHANGTFDMKGEIGMTAPIERNGTKTYIKRDGVLVPESDEYPFSREMGGSGIWRIERGYLYSTFTNSMGDWRIKQGAHVIIQTNSPSMRTNVENKDEIISITAQDFTKRDNLGRVQTATRKQ